MQQSNFSDNFYSEIVWEVPVDRRKIEFFFSVIENGTLSSAAQALRVSPTKSLLHALLSMRHLPEEHRRGWAEMFSHFVFAPAEQAAGHLPAPRRGVLDPQPTERIEALLAGLASGGKGG